MSDCIIFTVKKCPNENKPEHGRMGGGRNLGSQRKFKCDINYRVVGAPVIRCKMNGDQAEWSDSHPTCQSE